MTMRFTHGHVTPHVELCLQSLENILSRRMEGSEGSNTSCSKTTMSVLEERRREF